MLHRKQTCVDTVLVCLRHWGLPNKPGISQGCRIMYRLNEAPVECERLEWFRLWSGFEHVDLNFYLIRPAVELG